MATLGCRMARRQAQRNAGQRGPKGAPYARVGLSKRYPHVKTDPCGSAREIRFPRDASDLGAMLAAGYRP